MITLILKHRLIIAPPVISSVNRHFAGLEHSIAFYNLVREYLPEDYDNLLRMVPNDAADRFIKLFSEKHFPIQVNSSSGSEYINGQWIKETKLSNIIKSIPLEWHGLNEYNYESFYRMCKSQLLAEVILICPFERQSRVVVLGEFEKKIGEEKARPLLRDLELVKGYTLENVEDALKESPYADFAFWCKWIYRQTGNRWLDNSDYRNPGWTREEVDQLTREYPAYLEIDKRMKGFEKWLIVDFPGRSIEIIKYIANNLKKRLINIFKEDEHDQENQHT